MTKYDQNHKNYVNYSQKKIAPDIPISTIIALKIFSSSVIFLYEKFVGAFETLTLVDNSYTYIYTEMK